jgi:hypothetical protein
MSRRGRNRRNKQSIPTEVRITSIIKPYRADPIISFSCRYQANSNATQNINAARLVTRVMLLNALIVNLSSGTANSRLLQAVRVNKITVYTSASASIEWISSYGPTSAIMVNGTSTVSPGILVTRPPQRSLAGVWSLNGSNEGDNVFSFTCTQNDVFDVEFSAVLCDRAAGSSVTTISGGTAGFIYRTFLDGPAPAGSVVLVPVGLSYLN